MTDQKTKAHVFAELHQKNNPLIIYNIWDAGSAKAVVSSGAKAIATGDHPVAFAHGFSEADFDQFTFDLYLSTVKEIAARIGDVPLSIDISNANNLSGQALQERLNTVIEAGAVGVNFEDRIDNKKLYDPYSQAERIQTLRQAADALDIPLFINARTDCFMLVDHTKHATVLEEAFKRAEIYKQAGASGFFAPGLLDSHLIAELCRKVMMPVNSIRLPGSPTAKELTKAGVSRISYGPVPHIQMINWLKQKATIALAGED